MDPFEMLLSDLGSALGLILHPDNARFCRIRIEGLGDVQLEYEAENQRLLIAGFIAPLEAGSMRETVFKEALKANVQVSRIGNFAYSDRANQLVLYTYLPTPSLRGDALAALLKRFVETIDDWRRAIDRGQGGPS